MKACVPLWLYSRRVLMIWDLRSQMPPDRPMPDADPDRLPESACFSLCWWLLALSPNTQPAYVKQDSRTRAHLV